LSRTLLEVDLAIPIDWQKKYAGVSVDLSALDDELFEAIREGLPCIFRGTHGVLELAASKR
jgi:hypothetical protein